jgi:aspartyl/glutamyl-tRNA(Asn/Gln) amidotransferase C subunit
MTGPEGDQPSLQRLCDLARLQLGADRGREATERLGRVLQAFRDLAEVPTEGVEPTLYPLPLHLPMRPDTAAEVLGRDAALANAPRLAAGCFLVPRVVDA